MGKVVSLINTTPDGFIDAKYTVAGADFYEFTLSLLSDNSTIAFGRNTFELFQDRWPPILEKENVPALQLRMARAFNDLHKVVFSSTLKTTTWNNSSVIQIIDADYINSYKRDGHGGLLTLGSPMLVATLTEMNLVDDYYFFIQPMMAGAGKAGMRLFDKINLSKSLPLRLMGSKQLTTGVLVIHYQSVC
jgi:dihydrofolate reductase